MATAIDLCNRALMRLGTQSSISSFDDGSVEASVCQSFYDDVLESLLTHPASMAAPNYIWQWPVCTGSGQAVASDNNSQWPYEMSLPEDCIRVLRVECAAKSKPHLKRPYIPSSYDAFSVGMGKAGGDHLIPVILTNKRHISVAYITNAVDINAWPSSFRRAFWLSLASEIATTLGIDGGTSASVAQEAEREVARACLADQNVSVVCTDTIPSWIATRFSYAWENECPTPSQGSAVGVGYVAGGNTPPSPAPAPYILPVGINDVRPNGLQTRDIASLHGDYIPASIPDGRAGVLTIGQSPVGWRRPYHSSTINANAPDKTGEYDT